MFAIRINNQFLDLDPSATLKYNLNNPLFDPDSIARNFNFPLTFPLTPRNREILNFPERLDHSRNSYEYSGATLYLMHLPFEVGKAVITGTDAHYAELILQNVESDFLEDLSRIRIHEELETIIVTGTAPDAVWLFDLDGNAGLYQIELGGLFFQFNATTELPSEIAQGLSDVINATYPGFAIWSPGQAQLRLDSVLMNEYPLTIGTLIKTSFNSAVTVGESRWTRWSNYLDSVNNTPVASHCFPTIYWPGFYKGSNPRYINLVNPWAAAGGITPNEHEDNPWWRNTYAPQVRLPYVFSKIITKTEVDSIGGDFWNEADIQSLILLWNRCIDEVTEDYTPAERRQFFNHLKETFDLNRHVPEMTGRELLSAFIEFFQLYIRIEDGELQFVEKRTQLETEPLDWTSKVQANIPQDTVEKEGFVLSYESDANDTATVAGQLEDYRSGDETEIYRTQISTVFMDVDNDISIANKKVPFIQQAGSGDEAGLGDSRFQLRLLIYHGLQTNASNTATYPFASHDHIAADGTIIGNRSLDWNDAAGLYVKSWAGIPELNEGNVLNITAALTITDLIRIRKWEQPRIRFYAPDGEVTGIIKNVRVNVSQAGLQLSTITLIKQ